MTRRTQPILIRESGEFYIQKDDGVNQFVPLVPPEMDIVEIHRDLIDELELGREREIVMRMLNLPPYIRSPRTYIGIAREMRVSRRRVKEIFFQALKKIRGVVYAEAKTVVDKRRPKP